MTDITWVGAGLIALLAVLLYGERRRPRKPRFRWREYGDSYLYARVDENGATHYYVWPDASGYRVRAFGLKPYLREFATLGQAMQFVEEQEA